MSQFKPSTAKVGSICLDRFSLSSFIALNIKPLPRDRRTLAVWESDLFDSEVELSQACYLFLMYLGPDRIDHNKQTRILAIS